MILWLTTTRMPPSSGELLFGQVANERDQASKIRADLTQRTFFVASAKLLQSNDYYYRKFQNWCNLHNFISLPASTATVAIYLNSLVQRSVSVSVLYSNYYSIKWYHDLNLHSNPCDDKLISVFLEGGKRTLSKPIIKKDPITPDILNKIIDMYGKDHSNLKNVRLCNAFTWICRFS